MRSIFSSVFTFTALFCLQQIGSALDYDPDSGDGSATAIRADFNNDSYDDLVVSSPGVWIGGASRAGALYVIYGDPDGLIETDADYIFQLSPQEGGAYGESVAAGDFNGDGCDDLAIGIPGANRGRGSVHIHLGSPHGLTAFDVSPVGIPQSRIFQTIDNPTGGAGFGISLAVGRFNADKYTDLAIGEHGRVVVLKGGERRLLPIAIINAPNLDSGFGMSLAAGDFDNNQLDNLAIGAPFETVGRSARAGAVYVTYGPLEVAPWRRVLLQRWHQDSPGMQDTAEPGDAFGRTLIAGKFDAGDYVDLALGIPNEDIEGPSGVSHVNSGAVQILYGRQFDPTMPNPAGLSAEGSQFWTLDSFDLELQSNVLFGGSLAAANFNRPEDDLHELAIGIPGYRIDGIDGGAVVIGNSTPSGLTTDLSLILKQEGRFLSSTAGESVPLPGDYFGSTLAVGNFGGDETAELAIGIPHDDRWLRSVFPAGAPHSAGSVNVIYFSSGRVDHKQMWTPSRLGITPRCDCPSGTNCGCRFSP